MTAEVNHAAGGDLHRIDPALRAAAAGLDVLEFDAATLPLERDRLNHANARRAAAVDVISCAEVDPCRDEAVEYAVRLFQAYVHTELHVFAAAFQGFDSAAPDWTVSREVQTLHARSLDRAFGY